MKNTNYVGRENIVWIFIILTISCGVIILINNAAYSGYVSRTNFYSTIASDNDSLSRYFSANPVVINSAVNITLTKSLVSGRSAILIEEYVPSDFTIVDSGSGTVVNNTIRWAELQNVNSGIFTYSVIVSSVSSSYEFSGVYSIDGASATSISGDTLMNVTNEIVSSINFSISIGDIDINYTANSLKNDGNLSNITFNNNRGVIRFKDVILSKNVSINNSVMNISQGKIFIDSALLPEFNKEANLEFYNIFLNNPQVYLDGALCRAQCYDINYDSGAGIFYVTVSGFSEYEVVEGPYCGDDSCNNDETCNSCIIDCGSCPEQENPTTDVGGGSSYISSTQQNTNNPYNESGISTQQNTNNPYNESGISTQQNTNNPYNESGIVSTSIEFNDTNISINTSETYNAENIKEDLKESYNDSTNQQISDKSINVESVDKKNKYLTIITIGVVIIVVILVFITIIKRNSSLNENKTMQKFSEQQIFMERSINYVNSMRQRGYNDEYIKNSLRAVGWTDNNIEYLFKNIK